MRFAGIDDRLELGVGEQPSATMFAGSIGR
jgi:hypothetical protein